MILELDEELVEAPGVAPFFSCGNYTLDNLLTPEENGGVDDFGATGSWASLAQNAAKNSSHYET
jgi:hypothetical protein